MENLNFDSIVNSLVDRIMQKLQERLGGISNGQTTNSVYQKEQIIDDLISKSIKPGHSLFSSSFLGR